jgi:pimeloyl-ACP methyl ester carboxylesterase/DNA-binding SARP family transcriptional activator
VDEEQGTPPLRFAPATGGVRLAYQVFGEGPESVVAVPPTAQNIELAWEQPAIRRMLLRFATYCRYLHFDKRGTGCSDRRSRIGDVDERVEDIVAVMDHAGIERAHLMGTSEGGPMTLLLAATYPERVASVTLFGSGPTLHPPGLTLEDLTRLREGHAAFAARWGTGDSWVAEAFAPSLVASDPGFAAWHARYERYAATQDCLLELLELSLHLDVRDVLPSIAVPTLVLHRRDDRIVPIARGREVAAAVPGARFLELPGSDHFGYAGDVESWMRPFERFVTGEVRGAASHGVSANLRPTVRVRTLGRFAVEIDGEEVPVTDWGSRLARQLCKRLVAARGRPVTRDELFEQLWPGETDRRRLGARLSVQLSAVRRILRGGVVADRETVRLDLAAVGTDLDDLDRARTDEEVVAAYGGPFLPEDVYEGWTSSLRDEIDARFALAARKLAQTSLRAGRSERAVTLARRLLTVDAYDVAAHELLVTALASLDSWPEARRAHAAWCRAMAELGLPAPPSGGVPGPV